MRLPFTDAFGTKAGDRLVKLSLEAHEQSNLDTLWLENTLWTRGWSADCC